MTEHTSVESRAVTRLRVAALQTTPERGNIARNLEQIEAMIATVPGVDLIVTPELSVSGFSFRPDQVPEPMDVADRRLEQLARPGQTVTVGIVESSDGPRPYNSFVHLGASGSVQRKLHLVSYQPWNEHECYAAGSDLVQTDLTGVRVATLICNDAWHPVMPWLAVHSGAEVLLIPAASLGTDAAEESARTWAAILTQTARTLQCFVVFANRSGSEDGKRFWGGSRIIGPQGELLARADGNAGTITADLDISSLRELRHNVPLLNEARLDLVLRHVRKLQE